METENKSRWKSFLSNRHTWLAVFLLLAGGLYLFFWNRTTVLAGGVVLLGAHVAVAGGVLLLARGRLGGVFRKIWAHINGNTAENKEIG